MLDSSLRIDSRRPLDLIDDHFLSIITTLFVEEMAMDRRYVPPSTGSSQPVYVLEPSGDAPVAHVPYSKQTEAITLKEYGTRKALPRHTMRRSHPDRSSAIVRTFILGLSDVLNNLMMGIWGNLSLVGMLSDKSDSVFQRVSEMEHMIQSGSALINALFGYLSERRVLARNIRLNQLVQEISGALSVDGDRIKKDILRASLAAPASQNSPATLASNFSNLIRRFVEHLQLQYNLILSEPHLDKKVSDRMRIIAQLMARVLDIVVLLDRYAGREPRKNKKISAKVIITGLARKFEARFPKLEISLDLARRLPWIHGDRSGLQFVLTQLMENAAGAMEGAGKLHIEANPLNGDPSPDRYVALQQGEAIVIRVADTGHGMDLNTLLHIFDPFFSGTGDARRLGMGMAASWGIVKAHGGYIHVRSRLGFGSDFRIYLPIGSV